MSNKTYVLRAFMEKPWAILPSKLALLEEVVVRHVSGEKLDADEVQTRLHGATRPPERRVNKVAVLPLFGTIFPRANLMTEMSGATSAERFGAMFAALVNDPEIDAIVLDVDSPGGQIGGVEELSKQIYEARGKKRIVAVANHTMASAAYWIATAADEVVVTPSGEVGSIGVFAVHEDISGMLEKEGIKLSIIKEGKYKAEGNPYEPLSEEARAAIQESVSEAYGMFVKAVARNRGVKASAVRNGFGEGRMVSAAQAVELGMADRVATLNEVLERLFNKKIPASGPRGEAPVDGVRADDADSNVLSSEETPVESGLEPAAAAEPDLTPAQVREVDRAKLALAMKAPINPQGVLPMIRELQAQRAKLLDEATALAALADSENRDFTDEERARFNAIVGENGEIDALDKQIEQITKEREALAEKALKKVGAHDPQKPEAAPKTTMTRAEYDALEPAEQMAFTRNGGRVTE